MIAAGSGWRGPVRHYDYGFYKKCMCWVVKTPYVPYRDPLSSE